MPRPKKYASPAERNRAYRFRKKLRESEHPPQLDEVAKMMHKVCKDQAKLGLIDSEKFIGKTPYETLLRVVVYDLLFERLLPENADYDYPPLDKLVVPMRGVEPHLPSWMISPDCLSDEIAEYVTDCDEPVEEENEEDGNE
jgi:hypothetical protein